MEKAVLEKFINESCEKLNKTLISFCNNGEKGIKKSELITYWINDYIKYLKFEEEFIPNKLKIYERGDIVKVNFGFNIGNEEGGLHYAVVLDNKNPQSSGVITVVPLSSLKKDEVLSKYEVNLGSELYLLMKNKLDVQRKIAEEAANKFDEEVILCVNEINSCREMNDKVELLDGDKSKIFSLIEERLDFLENKINKLKESPILYANTDGIVSAINAKVGDKISAGVSIVDIGESAKVTAELTISQNDIVNIEVGQEVTLEISTYQDEKFKGKVTYLNLKPNSQGNSTTYSATVELEPTDYKLLEGMTVSAQFIIKEVKDVIMLSNKAIVLKDGKQFVKLKNEDGSTTEVEIQTGFSDGKNTEITGGLNEGDTVVIGG